MTEIPAFDKIAYCLKLIESKNEYIVLRELSILSCKEAIEEMNAMKDAPATKDRNIVELNAQIQRFQDEIDGSMKDLINIKKLIQKYEEKK